MKMKIIQLSVGKPKNLTYQSKNYVSGISKDTVPEAFLAKDCFNGDGVANPEFHGGEERAVCFYPFEHYAMWEAEFKSQLKIPAFGENLTVDGMREAEVFIGDIYQIGEAVIQISQGRIPCSTISKHNHEDRFLKRVFETGYTGYFGKVLKEGMIRQDSEIILIDRHPLEISVLEANQTLFHDFRNEDRINNILKVNELAEAWKIQLNKKLDALHS
ncbi:MOSC domain-containing protein [Falsibacillus pallidus]|nr:MOSC domain-containing protein [Falsibacillus pallidus]